MGLTRIRHLVLIVAFLLAQAISVQHLAKYGPDHTHDGHACDVVLFAKAAHLADTPTPCLVLPTAQTIPPAMPVRELGVATRREAGRPLPRAPPQLSSLA